MTGQGIYHHAKLAWLLGIRSRAFRGLAVIGVLLLFVAWLSGAFSLRQPAIVALDVGISGLKFLGTFFVLYWVQEIFVKDIERRTITLALVYPVPRSSYLAGRWLGVVALVAVTIVVWAGGLVMLSQVSDWGYLGSVRPKIGVAFPVVLFGILVDLLVVSIFTVWLASIAQTPLVPFLGGAGFAIAGRFVGPSMDYLALSVYADKSVSERMLPILDAIRWFIPDLSRLDWRAAVLYERWPPSGEMLGAIVMAVGYVTIFVVFAARNYQRREFS